ncbi:hypothetical protein [Paraburkholderia polaris]|uniref:hypothetical protein n=1 Tax=Paraburkholderia polaris TaxID=2728848 RepID=UPI00146B8A41|nr:hypothetical protein [Paraburkholderia polaris]
MSEYPCTGIDKAILKFGPQDSKISQNVSVKNSVFFLNFMRQLLPDSTFKRPIWRLSGGYGMLICPFSDEAYAAPFVSILRYLSAQKNCP